MCSTLSKRLKIFALERTQLSAAHLQAVQANDLATASQLGGPLFEACNGVHLYAERLREHQVSHADPRTETIAMGKSYDRAASGP